MLVANDSSTTPTSTVAATRKGLALVPKKERKAVNDGSPNSDSTKIDILQQSLPHKNNKFNMHARFSNTGASPFNTSATALFASPTTQQRRQRRRSTVTCAEAAPSLTLKRRRRHSTPSSKIEFRPPPVRHRAPGKSSLKRITSFSSSDSNDDTNDQRPKRSVQFSNLIIRTYSLTLGDHPFCSSGPALTLGWSYSPTHIQVKVDEFENVRSPRRNFRQLTLDPAERRKMLVEAGGYTLEDLRKAEGGGVGNLCYQQTKPSAMNNLRGMALSGSGSCRSKMLKDKADLRRKVLMSEC